MWVSLIKCGVVYIAVPQGLTLLVEYGPKLTETKSQQPAQLMGMSSLRARKEMRKG